MPQASTKIVDLQDYRRRRATAARPAPAFAWAGDSAPAAFTMTGIAMTGVVWVPVMVMMPGWPVPVL